MLLSRGDEYLSYIKKMRGNKKLIKILVLLILIVIIIIFGYYTYRQNVLGDLYHRSTNINLNNTNVELSDEFENIDQLNEEIHKLNDVNSNTQQYYTPSQNNRRRNIIIDYETDLIEPGTDHERTDYYLKTQ